MKGVQKLAADAAAARKPAAADNPFLALQTQVSDQIIAALDAYRVARDQMAEQMFFGFYGSPFVQALLGLNEDSEVRPFPGTSPEKLAARQAQADAYAAKLQTGGFDEALTRAVLYVIAAERMIDQRCALALNVARQKLMHLSLAEFKALVRDQSFVLQLERERAVEALASLVPEADARKELLKQVHAIVGAGDPPIAAERDRLARLSQVLAAPIEKTVALVTSGRPSAETTARALRGVALSGSRSITRACSAWTVDYAAMQTIVNKTFKEIAVGDTASVQRTLAGRRRAGLGRRLRRSGHACRPRREPGGCRHRHGHPDRAGWFGPPGTRDLDPHDLGADQGRTADRRGDDGATRRAGEAVGSGDRRAGRPVHRPGGSGFRHRDAGSSGADDAAATPSGGASARRACSNAVEISSRC